MANVSDVEKLELEKIYQDFFNNPLIAKMKEIPMHRGSNCFIHSFKVTKLAVAKAIKSKKPYNIKDVLVASILHDYYLYDWRKDREMKKKHGRRHPLVSEANARRDFAISDSVSEIIKTHMWPLTPKYRPKNRESKLVNYIDDIIATREFMVSKKYKAKHEERYIRYISRLFD